ncbi:MAG: cobalamin biosynthesis protein [Ramlibacter sp.]
MMVAGFGFRAGATLASLRAALGQAVAECGFAQLPSAALVLIATAQNKAGAPCLQALAATLNLPICAVTSAQIASTATLTESALVRAWRNTGSVAEAAALAAAKKYADGEARLLHRRAVSPDRLATCAIASFTSFRESLA